MTKQEIAVAINSEFPGIYAPTTEPTKLIFSDGAIMIGYFQPCELSDELEKENKFSFVQYGLNAHKYKETNNVEFITIIDGDLLVDIEHPSYR